ncbi:MAG: hypothetical protein AB3N18_18010, partial [Allomuricauda sp.]
MSKFLLLRYQSSDLEKNTGKTYVVIVVLFMLFSVFCEVKAQNFVAQKEYYQWFDKKTGTEHSNLYEGILSIEKYGTLNGNHKFFESLDYLNG